MTPANIVPVFRYRRANTSSIGLLQENGFSILQEDGSYILLDFVGNALLQEDGFIILQEDEFFILLDP